tara:strand:+ start:80 stop:436 length:357 start_codon:yes stop_codon:yes gene_type:complete
MEVATKENKPKMTHKEHASVRLKRTTTALAVLGSRFELTRGSGGFIEYGSQRVRLSAIECIKRVVHDDISAAYWYGFTASGREIQIAELYFDDCDTGTVLRQAEVSISLYLDTVAESK